MTLRDEINAKFGSLYGFAREKGINSSVAYSLFSGHRAASKNLLDLLVREFGDDVMQKFDSRGLLIAGL